VTCTDGWRVGWIWDVCFRSRETRVVQNDWTLRFENRWFQLAETHQKLALAGRAATVCQRLDGRLEVLYGGGS